MESAPATHLLPPHRRVFRAFAATVVPALADVDDAAWAEMEHTIEHALAQRPPKMRRQLALFLRVLDHLPRGIHGRPFHALDAARRTRVIDMLEHAPVLLIRRGVWGLRTLVLMGFYTRPAVMHDVGYRAHPGGWEARMRLP